VLQSERWKVKAKVEVKEKEKVKAGGLRQKKVKAQMTKSKWRDLWESGKRSSERE